MSASTAVIIGGSSGIGFATARHLLDLGYDVTITGRTPEHLSIAKKALGENVSGFLLDATDADAIAQTFARIDTFDHLILALGNSKGGGPFANAVLDDVRQGFEEKVFAHFACAQAALPFLTPGGSITFISAVSAHVAMPGTAGLGAANAAIAALVPTLASELRPLRVNAVSPGVIDTPWWDFFTVQQRAEVFADYAGKTPVGRVGNAQDIADAIAFLLGNTFITGQTLVVDGGLSLGN